MLDLGDVRDRAEFKQRLAVTAALLIAYRLGAYIPLPGINPEALAQLGGTAVERISIFALGIGPLVTVLILAELLKVLAPRVRGWERAAPRNRDKLNRIVVGAALLAAAVQASGLALALEDVAHLVDEPGTAFRLTCIASLAGGAAVVIWLADQITRHGLGSGVWLLFVAPWIADLSSRYAALAAWQSDAAVFALQLAIACAVAALVLAAAVRLLQAGGGTPETRSAALWSVLLANAAWPWALLLLALVLGDHWIRPASPVALLTLAVLVTLFAHLYLRAQRVAGAPVSPIPPAVLAWGLAAITFADIGFATQLPGLVPLAGHLVLVAIVALGLLARWWQPPFVMTAEDAPRNDAA